MDKIIPISLSNIEIKEMANTLSNAFISHSNFVNVIKKQEKRQKALYQSFLMMCKVINKHGYIFKVVRDDITVGYINYMDPLDNILKL